MTAVRTPPPVRGGDDVEAIIKRARRRQRRRRAAIGAAAVAALAAAALGIRAHDRQAHGHASGARPPVATHPLRTGPIAPVLAGAGTAVLLWPVGAPAFGPQGGPPAYLANLQTGRLAPTRRVAIAAGDYQPLLLAVGHWLVYAGNGTTAIRDNLRGAPRELGKTPFFAPSAAPDRIWLEYLSRRPFQSERVRSVSIASGRLAGPPVTLPRGARLVEGTIAGLLLQDRRGRLELWNRRGPTHILPGAPLWADGFAADGQRVAYGMGCAGEITASSSTFEPDAGYDACRILRILDVRTGRVRSFATPPGTAGWVPGGLDRVDALSADGDEMAAYAATQPQGHGRTRLYELALAGPRRAAIPVPSSTANLFAPTGWTTVRGWLLYQGPNARMRAYRAASGTVRRSTTPCCRYSVMATFQAADR